MEWRLLLHQYANFLTYFYKDKLPNQHGFLPGRGTLTAWQEIFVKGLYRKKYIREWDFKSFFDSVHNNRITEILLATGTIKSVAYFLENINRSNVKLPEEQLLDESVKKSQEKQHKDIKEGIEDFSNPIYQPYKDFIDSNIKQIRQEMKQTNRKIINVEDNDRFENWSGNTPKWSANTTEQEIVDHMKMLLKELFDLVDAESPQEFVQMQWALLDSYKPHKVPGDFNGVAQGMPTSPILANLIMNEWVSEHSKVTDCVAYADDSVSFSDYPIEITPPADTGIVINTEKSGYVKYDNEWLRPLKFLGLEFNGKEFKANTRKGSTLKLSKKQQLLMEACEATKDRMQFTSIEETIAYLKERRKTEDKFLGPSGTLGHTWEEWFQSRIIGFIQSRLYNGKWDLDNLNQDFNLLYTKQSLCGRLVHKLELDVFNSTSYACRSLLNTFRWNQKLRSKVITQFTGLVTSAKCAMKLIQAKQVRSLENKIIEDTKQLSDFINFKSMISKGPFGRVSQIETEIIELKRAVARERIRRSMIRR
jgi:hypothetical protein